MAPLLDHERLDVCQSALRFVGWSDPVLVGPSRRVEAAGLMRLMASCRVRIGEDPAPNGNAIDTEKEHEQE